MRFLAGLEGAWLSLPLMLGQRLLAAKPYTIRHGAAGLAPEVPDANDPMRRR